MSLTVSLLQKWPWDDPDVTVSHLLSFDIDDPYESVQVKKKNLMIEKQIKVLSLQWHCFAEIDWAISSVNASEKDSSGKPPFQTASSWYTRCTSNTHTNNFSFLNSDVTPNVVCIAIFSVKVCSYPVKWIFTLCSSLCNMKLMKCSNLSMKLSTLKWQVFQFYCPTHVLY